MTGLSRSLRWKPLADPFVYEKLASGMPITTLGLPPDAYWHSRQWHWTFMSGSPFAL